MGIKTSRIPLIKQESALRVMFPGCQITRIKDESISWTHTLTPTPLSDSYKVKLKYVRNKEIKFYVLEPKLILAEGKNVLPHVYSTPEQRLCLFYPNSYECDDTMLFTKTIIPWASEWLYFYEIWVGTGIWYGGGIDHKIEDEKQPRKGNK